MYSFESLPVIGYRASILSSILSCPFIQFFNPRLFSSCTQPTYRNLKLLHIFFLFSEHFPYFKTAPAGWKNSVRHNLSLNKCFEKIEKPSVGGTNQRKGCLWAMNPAKITKMDEEVLKWSRKDPMAIKKGMVHPRKCLYCL